VVEQNKSQDISNLYLLQINQIEWKLFINRLKNYKNVENPTTKDLNNFLDQVKCILEESKYEGEDKVKAMSETMKTIKNMSGNVDLLAQLEKARANIIYHPFQQILSGTLKKNYEKDKKNINQEEEINDIVRNQESKKFRAPKKEEEKIMKKMEVLDEIELEDNDEGEMTMEEEIKIREAEKKINLESEDRINRNEKNPELSSNLTHIVDIPKPHYKILIGVLPTRSVDIILHNISLQDDINIAGIEVFDDKINGQERLNCFIYLESIQSAEDFINRHKLFGVIIEGRRCPVESVEKKKKFICQSSF